jgi:RHS repeat-associated protein
VTCTTRGHALGTTFSYDTRGNRTGITPSGGATTTLGYDQANRLVSYRAMRRMLTTVMGCGCRKTVSGTAENFSWDQSAGLPLPLLDATPTVSTYFVFGPCDVPIEQIVSSGSITYFYHDQLGSTRALADATGVVVGTATYDSFGIVLVRTGSATATIGFAGQYTDIESGFQYLHARSYDASTGQFLSRDPMVAATRAPYGYVGDNPLNGTDPSGMCPPFVPDFVCNAAGTVAGGVGHPAGAVGGAVGSAVGAVGGALETAADAAAPVVWKVGGAVATVGSFAAAGCAVIAAPTIVGESVCGGIEGVALGAGALTTAADTYLAARGKGSWGAAGLDALGLATGGLGRWGKGLDALAGAEYAGSMGLREFANAFSFGFSGFAYGLGLADEFLQGCPQ